MLLKSEIAYDHPLNIQNFDGISLIEHDLNNNLAGKIKNSSEIVKKSIDRFFSLPERIKFNSKI